MFTRTLKRLLLAISMCCLVWISGCASQVLLGANARGAAQGDADAQYNLGVMYRKGQGVSQNDKEAVKWYKLAATQGNVSAQNNLGVMYRNGLGVPQDSQEALKWYRLAAAQGDADAQYNLGVMYDSGQGVTQDDKEAVKWYKLAAEQGQENATVNLKLPNMIAAARELEDSKISANSKWQPVDGELQSITALLTDDAYAAYKGGDYEKALGLYRPLAKQGNVKAQLSLGFIYHDGRGVTQDYQEAVKWYKLAAEQGDAEAQSSLGMMYDNGHGVGQDKQEAMRWYRLAAAQGNANATDNLKNSEMVAGQSASAAIGLLGGVVSCLPPLLLATSVGIVAPNIAANALTRALNTCWKITRPK